MCIQVFFRYDVARWPPWLEEGGTLCVWLVCHAGSGMCMGKNKHLRLDVRQLLLPPNVWSCLIRISSLVGTGFFVFLAWLKLAFYDGHFGSKGFWSFCALAPVVLFGPVFQ
jgi:TRAP-type C4-dicarboxylate transport system permease small subunit